MPTEPIDRFEINGREFLVLWKETAAYLRADGHMWGGSLGAGLTPEEAKREARIRAAFMIDKERYGEETLVHQLYLGDPPPNVARVLSNYEKLVLRLGSESFPVVWAPFNRNTYVCLADGWSFADTAASADEALAKTQAFVEALPKTAQRSGRPDAPPDEEPRSTEPEAKGKAPSQPRSIPLPSPSPNRKPRPWITIGVVALSFMVVVGLGIHEGTIRSVRDVFSLLAAVFPVTMGFTVLAALPLAIASRPKPLTDKHPMMPWLALGSLALAAAWFVAPSRLDGWTAFQSFGVYVVACYVVGAAIRDSRRTRARALVRLDDYWQAILGVAGMMLDPSRRATATTCGATFGDPAWPGRVVWDAVRTAALFQPRTTVEVRMTFESKPAGRLFLAFDKAAFAFTRGLADEQPGNDGLRGVVLRMVSPLASAYHSIESTDPLIETVAVVPDGKPWQGARLYLGVLRWRVDDHEVDMVVAIEDKLLRRLLETDDARREPGTPGFRLTKTIDDALAAFEEHLAGKTGTS